MGWSKYEDISSGLGRRVLYLIPPGEPRPNGFGDVERVGIVIAPGGEVKFVAVNDLLRKQYEPDFLRFRQTMVTHKES